MTPLLRGVQYVSELIQAARMMPIGGRLVLNMMYTIDFRADEKPLGRALEKFGLRVVPEFTGEVASGETYKSRVLVFEKSQDVSEPPENIIKSLSPEELNGFRFLVKSKQEKRTRERRRLSKRDRVIADFSLGERSISVVLNDADQKLRAEEQRIIDEVEEMKDQHSPQARRTRDIPKELLIEKGYGRWKDGELFKKVLDGAPITLD